MTIDTIDAAILVHQRWVAGFQNALRESSTATFDIGAAQDDFACALGQCLQSERSRVILGIESHKRITAAHASFHEMAGYIAGRLNHHDSGQEIDEWIFQLNSLSYQLVAMLRLTKKKMHLMVDPPPVKRFENRPQW